MQCHLWDLLAPHWLRFYEDEPPGKSWEIEEDHRKHLANYLAAVPFDSVSRKPTPTRAATFETVLAASERSWGVLSHILPTRHRDEDGSFDWCMPGFLSRHSLSLNGPPTAVQIVHGVVFRAIGGGSLISLKEIMPPLASALERGRSEPVDSLSYSSLSSLIQEILAQNKLVSETLVIQLLDGFFRLPVARGQQDKLRGHLWSEPSPLLAEDIYVYVLTLAVPELDALFVEHWNATIGSSERTLEYSKPLQHGISRLQDQGHVLRLPGWLKVSFCIQKKGVPS